MNPFARSVFAKALGTAVMVGAVGVLDRTSVRADEGCMIFCQGECDGICTGHGGCAKFEWGGTYPNCNCGSWCKGGGGS